MVDTKISALTGVISADLSDDDLFHVVDTSTSSNKKITAKELTIYNQRLASLSESMTHTLVCPPELHIPALADDDTWRFDASLSWYNETLTGTWLGEAANETAARAISDTTGAYYHNTTDGKFYKLNAGSGQTEVFRGNTASFPAAVGVVAEAARVILYDLTVEGCPMWKIIDFTGYTIKSVFAIGGIIYVGTTAGLVVLDFAADSLDVEIAYSTSTSPAIVNNTVNAVSATILPSAPIDPATGQKVQTVMVHTDGGVTQLGWDGVNTDAAWDITHPSGASYNYSYSGCFLKDGRLAFTMDSVNGGRDVFVLDRLTADVVLNSSGVPQAVLTTSASRTNAVQVASDNSRLSNITPTDKGFACTHSTLGLLEVELSDPKAVRIVNKDFNTGMMPKGTVLSVGCDKDSSSLVGTELWAGAFTRDDGAWTDNGDGSYTANGGTGFLGYNPDNRLTVGKRYYAFITVDSRTSGTVYGPYDGVGSNQNSKSATGEFVYFFTAGSTGLYIYSNEFSGTVSNISFVEALPDHSVTGLGFKTIGTINRTAVASGATMTALGGFSATDYLEQPVNSALNVGTGDFWVRTWVKGATTLSVASIVSRCSSSTNGFHLYKNTTTVTPAAMFRIGSAVLSGTTGITDQWNDVVACRKNGVAYIYKNGSFESSAAATANIDGSFVTQIGWSTGQPTTTAMAGIAMVRFGTVVPSALQIAWWYYTEKKLLEPNAKAFLAGASNTVLGVAYDAYRGETYAWQADYRNVMLGGKRIGELAGTFTKGGSVFDNLIVEG